MAQKRPRASNWKCDEFGLSILTPTGPVQLYIEEVTMEEVHFFYLGRLYIYERKFEYATRKYVDNPGTPGEHWRATVSDLSRALMNAQFAMLQPAWVRKRPYIWVDGEKLQFCRVSQRYFEFRWNDARYAFYWNQDDYDIEIMNFDPDAPDLPEALCRSLLWFVVRIWHAVKKPYPLPRFDASRYAYFVSMENPMNKPKRSVPTSVRMARERLNYAERNGHPVEEIDSHVRELRELGQRGAAAKNGTTSLSAPEIADKKRRQIMENEACAMGIERGDHHLPEDERPPEFQTFAA